MLIRQCLSRCLIIFLSMFMLQSCASLREPADLQQGKRDFLAGKFKIAFRELLPLAANGNSEAEYAIGYMYYYGEGVSQDTDTGLFWIKRSAAKGFKPAQQALQIIEASPPPEHAKGLRGEWVAEQ